MKPPTALIGVVYTLTEGAHLWLFPPVPNAVTWSVRKQPPALPADTRLQPLKRRKRKPPSGSAAAVSCSLLLRSLCGRSTKGEKSKSRKKHTPPVCRTIQSALTTTIWLSTINQRTAYLCASNARKRRNGWPNTALQNFHSSRLARI